MDQFEPQLVVKKEVRFSENFAESNLNAEKNFGDVFGGILKSGQWGWLTKGSRLCITSLRTGQLISKFDFDDSNGFGVCIITCVSEIQLPYMTDTIVAIGIQYADCTGGLAVIYSIEESTVIRCIELKHKITCCKFISHDVSQHTVLQNMNGCLAIGTDGGRVLLVDLNVRGDEMNASRDSCVSVVPCHIVDYSMSLLHLHRHFQHCQQEGVHFGIQLEVLENAEFIQSLLPIDLILSLAVGLSDGRLVLYDLTDIQVFYVAPPQERSSPLVKMNFMEPPDDPRSCVYIWAFHENYQNSMAVMHSFMYEKRVVADDGFCYFENFQVSCVRLLLPLNCPKSVPITCQSITKAPSYGNEETISLCALIWKQDQELQTEVLLFDINQWYKEEMPYVGDWREDPSYLASFVLTGLSSLEMHFNPNTISLFNSIQRPEEHFYPVSLSFDAIALGENNCVHLNWPGAQNRVVNVLRSKGSLALLDPNPIFNEILNTRLLPQFSGLNYKATFSLKAKRETLLSVAIEQNCIGLLKECVRNWADGSHQGKSLSEGLSMSTITDWLWARASSIKERCNNLCQVLFNHSGCTLDQRDQKELGYISKQLKTLADLLCEIVTKFGENIPSDVLNTLESQGKSIRMASDYQEILLWLLNIGLLPEASRLTRHREVEFNLVPYPYESLRRFYEKRRAEFSRLNEKLSSRKTRSCYLLFIDSFIEHEFKRNSLRDSWQESGGDGLYPPTSIQAMLRIMLISDVTFDNKCALFLYFFLDLNMAIEEKQYEPIVQNFIKFPSVFKLSASLIKQIQAFWNLDHCRFEAAVDEFISPFNKDQVCPQWQLELFLESLLAQNEANLALRVLEAKSSPISPVLQLNTYLANDLISEAFHFARSKQDEDLLKLFFTGCLCTGKFGVIRDLALTEREGNLVQSLLKNSKSRNAENLHFVYLLQKYKYIEAVSYLDEISKGRAIQRAIDVDTPTLVLSAYNTTITPVTKCLSDVYFKMKSKIKSKEAEQISPYPLSCQLIKQNANDLLGGIYHSSALSTHFASHYWERHQKEENTLEQTTNAPFLRRPQVISSYSDYNQKESISYPDPYKAAQKHRLDSNSVEEERGSKVRENPKKRRKIYERTDLDTIYKPLWIREQPTADNLLTHFKNVSTNSQDMTNFTRSFQKTPPQDESFFLATPFVRNTIADNSGSGASNLISEKKGTSLQSILKVSLLNPKLSTDETDRLKAISVESEKKEKKDIEEEKSIRFILPLVEDESDEEADEDCVSMENDENEEQSRGQLPQSLCRHAGPSKRKSLRSCSSYTSSVRVLGSPLKKTIIRDSEKQSPSKLSTTARDFSEYMKNVPINEVEKRKFEPADQPTSNDYVYPISVADALRKSRAEDSKEQLSFITSDSSSNEKSDSINITRSSLRKTRTDDSGEQPTSKISARQSSVIGSRPQLRVTRPIQIEQSPRSAGSSENITNIPIGLNQSEDSSAEHSEEDTSLNMNIKVVRLRSPLSVTQSMETEQQTSYVAPVRITEPKWFLTKYRSNDSNKQTTDTPDNVRIIPVISVDENFYSQNQPESNNNRDMTGKLPNMLLSESTEDQMDDSIERSTKQLKGRMSIHNSSRDISVFKSSTSPDSKVQPTLNQQPIHNIFKTDTIIDFHPHVSSSKVCATESKFNVNSTESCKVYETDSRFQSENSTSKVTYSERSTVVGGLTYLPTIETTEHVTETVNITMKPRDKMFDTTVDMTLYDTMGFETSHQNLSSGNIENSLDASSYNRDLEEESINSELNAITEQALENCDRDSDSVILLSSRSSSRSFYGESSEDSSKSRVREPTTAQIVIDDEEYGNDSVEIDSLDKSTSGSENCTDNLFSDQFSEVTRASTSFSIQSNTDTVLSSAAELEAEAITFNRSMSEIEEGDIDEDILNIESVTFASKKNKTNRRAIEETTTTDELEPVENIGIAIDAEENELILSAAKNNDEETPKEILKKESSPEELKKKIESEEQRNHRNPVVNKQIEEEEKLEIIAAQSEKTQNRREENQEFKETQSDQDISGTANETTEAEKKEKQQNVEEVVTPNVRGKRSKSVSKALTVESDVAASPRSRRNSRGGSMPPSSANQIITRRRSLLLETLDENATPDSPSSRTRSKLCLDSIDDDVDSPSISNIKRTRLSSISSVASIEHPQTPKSRRRTSTVEKERNNTPKAVVIPRATRAKSITSEINNTSIKTPRRLSISQKSNSPIDETSTVPDNSKKRTNTEEEHVTENPELSQSDDYASSRRLTRTQLAVLEKSAALAKQYSTSPVRVTRRGASRTSDKNSPPTADVKESDSESISSRISRLSNTSRRVTRSSALKENAEDDAASISSSIESGRSRKKRTKSTTSPIVALKAIPEEDPSGSEESLVTSQTSKRSRRQQK